MAQDCLTATNQGACVRERSVATTLATSHNNSNNKQQQATTTSNNKQQQATPATPATISCNDKQQQQAAEGQYARQVPMHTHLSTDTVQPSWRARVSLYRREEGATPRAVNAASDMRLNHTSFCSTTENMDRREGGGGGWRSGRRSSVKCTAAECTGSRSGMGQQPQQQGTGQEVGLHRQFVDVLVCG